MSIRGIHHLTAVCSNAQRTVEFYTGMLGMRLVKQTVNFDDTGSYHLYFGDASGSPGTLITFFEWKALAPGNWGIGTTHHLAFSVGSVEAQTRWKRWLQDRGIAVTGPYDRRYFRSIYFSDPDGLILEIATAGPGWTVDESEDRLGRELIAPPEELRKGTRDERLIAGMTWPEPVSALTGEMKLQGLHHITAIASNIDHTTAFYTDLLEMRLLKKTLNFDDLTAPHYYFGVGEGRPGTVITYFGYAHARMRRGSIGTGMTHHFAFAVNDDDAQRGWRDKLLTAGVAVTPVMDRKYFRSIYFSDPDGHVLEIATSGPGFVVDESIDSLGSELSLPAWLEPERSAIAASLTPLSLHENH
jgi:glyoxalase family protein